MISLTPVERRIRRILIGRARAVATTPIDPCITYEALGLEFDPDGQYHRGHPMSIPPFRGLGEALGHVSMYEAERGRPLLTALVVRKAELKPGPGFGDLARHLGFDVSDEEAFWEDEVEAVVDFWSDDDPTRIVDAALERVVRDLVTIKRLLRS